mgnify:CR=1 FL=1
MAEINLSKYGITGTTEIVYNPSYEELFKEEMKPELKGYEKGQETELGAVNVMTGIYTGRSPKDKFIVEDENSKNTVWWTSDEYKNDNHRMSQETWAAVKDIAKKELSNKRLFVVDAFCGANKDTRMAIRFIVEVAWQAHFVTNMFIKPTEEELKNFEPDFVVYNASKAKVENYKELGLNSETCVAFNITSREQVIVNTWYGGEMKKGMFSMMNYYLPLKGIASMHCSANTDMNGENTAIFFGLSGTGKTTLATSLQSFFLHGVDPPNLGVTSVPAMNDRVSQAVNTLAVLDEYKNDLDIRKIAYLKGLWGGGGQTKKNTNTDGMAAQTIVTTGVALCSQDKPTQDMALYTRVIFLAFSKTSFNQNEKRAYEDLVSVCNMGLTHLTLEILGHRELFEKNFPEIYSITKRELAAKLDNETIHDRIFGNWVIPLATFRTLETVIDVPFSYVELFDTAIKGIRNQNELAQESSEIADFWSMLQGFQTSGKCIEKAHYRIRYMKSFRPLSVKEDIEFKEARPILYLNTAAVASLFNSRNAGSTSNRSNWSTIMSYLKSHASYLGLKQDRFTILLPSGLPDYTIDIVNGEQVKKVKVNRPKALCFDYLQLKETFGLDLETEVVAEVQDMKEEMTSGYKQYPEQKGLF